jgi:hypothetical protein
MDTTTKRWPEFDGWDEKAEAIETLAKAVGAHAYCSQKYQHLNVEIRRKDCKRGQHIALEEVASMIEALTDLD